MMVIGMYGAVMLAGWGIDPLLAVPLVAALLFLIGYALQRGVINAFIARPEHMQFILLVGFALMIANGLLMIFGPDARSTNVEYASRRSRSGRCCSTKRGSMPPARRC